MAQIKKNSYVPGLQERLDYILFLIFYVLKYMQCTFKKPM